MAHYDVRRKRMAETTKTSPVRLNEDIAPRVERERNMEQTQTKWVVSTAAMVNRLVCEALDAREARRKATK